mgnify:CR=1 FL=1|tara:strand:- start:3874 stop:4194 length:321 start_codon:yes stop_codon:yes gene_type:complete
MSQDRYLEMQEQLGKEPDLDEMPPSWDDLPEVMIHAVNTFSQLGDRIFPDVGYIGKDYTNLSVFISLYDVVDDEFFINVLTWLDSKAIKSSQDQLKRERDKLNRKR